MAETLVRDYKVTILVNVIFFIVSKYLRGMAQERKVRKFLQVMHYFDLTYNLL